MTTDSYDKEIAGRLYGNYEAAARAHGTYTLYILISLAILLTVILAYNQNYTPGLVAVRNNLYAVRAVQRSLMNLSASLDLVRDLIRHEHGLHDSIIRDAHELDSLLRNLTRLEQEHQAWRMLNAVEDQRDAAQRWIEISNRYLRINAEPNRVPLDTIASLPPFVRSTADTFGRFLHLIHGVSVQAELRESQLRSVEANLAPAAVTIPLVNLPVRYDYALAVLPVLIVVLFALWNNLFIRKEALWRHYIHLAVTRGERATFVGGDPELLAFPSPLDARYRDLQTKERAPERHVLGVLQLGLLLAPLVLLVSLALLLALYEGRVVYPTSVPLLLVLHSPLVLYLGHVVARRTTGQGERKLPWITGLAVGVGCVQASSLWVSSMGFGLSVVPFLIMFVLVPLVVLVESLMVYSRPGAVVASFWIWMGAITALAGHRT